MRLTDLVGNAVTRALQPPAPQPQPPANATRAPGTGFDFTDTFTAAVGGVSTQAASTDPNSPRAIPTPSDDYYQQRHDDFVRRNPGVTPPDYYLDYGQKYLDRFQSLGPGDLSDEGLAWRDRTLENLQVAIEEKRLEDPEGFAELERDPEKFREFAYETHADAYTEAGLFELPVQDLVKIATTPDLRDLINEDGLRQILEVAKDVRPEDLPGIAQETFEEGVNQLRERLENLPIPLPPLPDLPGIPLPELPSFPTPPLPDLPDLPDLPGPDLNPFNL